MYIAILLVDNFVHTSYFLWTPTPGSGDMRLERFSVLTIAIKSGCEKRREEVRNRADAEKLLCSCSVNKTPVYYLC